jgi:hypothetical protein
LKDLLLQLNDEREKGELSRFIDISYFCIQQKSNNGRTMSAIYQFLTNDVVLPGQIIPYYLAKSSGRSSHHQANVRDRPLPQSYVPEDSDINRQGFVSIELQPYTRGEIASDDEGILMREP